MSKKTCTSSTFATKNQHQHQQQQETHTTKPRQSYGQLFPGSPGKHAPPHSSDVKVQLLVLQPSHCWGALVTCFFWPCWVAEVLRPQGSLLDFLAFLMTRNHHWNVQSFKVIQWCSVHRLGLCWKCYLFCLTFDAKWHILKRGGKI